MTLYIGLLRAVNLAGRNRVKMADLRRFMTDLGMEEVRSLLGSGNLVFRSDVEKPGRLESLLEEEAAERLGLETDFFVRTADEWRAIVAANPLPDESERDPRRFLVYVLKEAPGPKEVKVLQEKITGSEVVRAEGRQLYVVYPDGIGRSRLTSSVIERALGTRGTGRNWNTVLKLEALAEADGS